MLLEKEHLDFLEKENRRLIIGCPIKNDMESAKEMHKSFIESTNTYDEFVFVVGYNTNKDTIDWLMNLGMSNNKIKILNEQTKTPIKAYNFLFNYAKERKADLLLTQTDVLFAKLYKNDWLKIMKDIAKEEDIGAVTTLNGGGYSGTDYIDGFYWLGGWCTYIPFRTIEKIGGYDESFPNVQYGVDIDWTYRLVKENLKIVRLDYWIHHHQQNERLHDKHQDTEIYKKECAEYFRKKWKLGEFKDVS